MEEESRNALLAESFLYDPRSNETFSPLPSGQLFVCFDGLSLWILLLMFADVVQFSKRT